MGGGGGVLDTKMCPQIHTRPSFVVGLGDGVGVGVWGRSTPGCVHKYTPAPAAVHTACHGCFKGSLREDGNGKGYMIYCLTGV